MERWETDLFKKLRSRRDDFEFAREVESEGESLLQVSRRVRQKVNEFVSSLNPPPSLKDIDAIMIIVLYVSERFSWQATNDVVVALIASAVLQDQLRAHDDGVVLYRQGAYQQCQGLRTQDMTRIEEALQNGAAGFKMLMDAKIERRLDDVLGKLESGGGQVAALPMLDSSSFLKPRDADAAIWAWDAMKAVSALTPRFNGKTASALVIELTGAWMQQPKPVQDKTTVAFPDSYVQVNTDPGMPRLENRTKKPEDNCYLATGPLGGPALFSLNTS